MSQYQVIWLEGALEDVEYYREYIAEDNPNAAQKVAELLIQAGYRLSEYPERGVPVNRRSDYRDLIIPCGKGSYTLRYRIKDQYVVIAMVKHSKQQGFRQR